MRHILLQVEDVAGVERYVFSLFYLIIFEFSKHFESDLKYFQAESMSITSVLYLKDEVSLATAGAVDRFVTNFATYNIHV